MSLGEYRRKRRFDATPEPSADRAAPRGARAMFVVQLHHASRRHYDFRLQVGDTLRSWAVPKGPSYDPAVKRMAVEVEDHPLDYAAFEGHIPKGHYGGGHVARFDSGVWSSDGDVQAQLRKGHLRFELFGEKLKGGWHLVRSGKPAKQPQWLLFKDKDAYAGTLEADDLLAGVKAPPAADARRAGSGKAAKKRAAAITPAPRRRRRVDWQARALKLPAARKARLPDAPFAPQLARLGDVPPAGAQWLHELKWDGYRLVTTVVGGKVRIWSRNGLEWTHKLPEIREAIERLGLESAALDGELIAGAGTQADFNLLQATLSGESQGALSYVLFDLLHLQGVAVDRSPLAARKALLADLLEPMPRHLAFSSHVAGDGEAAYALAGERAFEGIISKRADRPYAGGRSDDWRKTKHLASDEFAVVGYTPGKGSRSAGFGSLLLARPDGDGGWRYAGRVGSGFSDELLRTLARLIGKRGASEPSVDITAPQRRELGTAVRWFAPLFVVEVNTRGTGGGGVLRQASLKAVRSDKAIADLTDPDRAVEVAKEQGMATSARGKPTTKTRAAGKPVKAAAEPIRISSPDRIVFAEAGITKAGVAAYYASVMPHLLPEIAGRPLSVIRCPDGTAGECFFQKHLTAGLKRVGTRRLLEESGKNADYLVVEDAEGLMELVQFNALEFHPWGAKAKTPDRADRVVFDLDPGPGVPFAAVRRAAADVRRRLEAIGLVSFLRTTGGKGLHVVVPLNPGCDWDLVKRFAHGFADALAGSEPDRFIAVSTLKKRPGKIFVDYLRNGRGATAVASYSLRARPGAPVAMPLPWSALSRLTGGDHYTLANAPAHLKRRRVDPWEGIARLKQNLRRWAKAR